jgi:emericellamide synthase (highly reducing iterative type I polyketide synthase)
MGDLVSETEVMVNGNHGKVNGLGSEGQEPIAIIGIGCRYPGGASTPQKLWDILASGKSAWSKGPENRFNMDAFYDADNSHPSVVSDTPSPHRYLEPPQGLALSPSWERRR